MHLADINKYTENQLIRISKNAPVATYHKGDTLWNTVMATYLWADRTFSEGNKIIFWRNLLTPRTTGYQVVLRFPRLESIIHPTCYGNRTIATYVGNLLVEHTTGSKGFVIIHKS